MRLMRAVLWIFWAVLSAAWFGVIPAVAQTKFLSHPPIRPLPVSSNRPFSEGPGYFVDVGKGNDKNDGSKGKPWQTLQYAVQKLKPGDTLYLRGGIYFEHVVVTLSGTAKQPVTIRSYPGELAILDGGLRDFFEEPAKAWEPCPGGVEGEYWSAKTYPDLGGRTEETNVLGNFADSMVPLQGYHFLRDLRSNNIYWNFKDRLSVKESIYCGPGIYYDPKTGRIHARLAHTNMKYMGEDNYSGETDPRKVPLVIAGFKGGPPLTVRGAKFLRVQDLVVRGSRKAAVEVDDCQKIEFDGLTVYGGASAFAVRDTWGLRLLNTACRGIAAPWTFRGSLKYRSIEARIFSASGWSPTGKDNRDFELAYSEFTDSVDGVFIGNVKNVKFHHNLLDNVSDDGIFLTAGTAYDGTTPGGHIYIYQNLLSRCLTTFAFGVGHGRQKWLPEGKMQTGSGVFIYRNVFDYRKFVPYHQPSNPNELEVKTKGRFAGDHGSPAWEPMTIYHNTIIADDPATYAYGTYGLAGHSKGGSKRQLFNNIVVQTQGMPGTFFPPTKTTDLQADYNLHWSAGKGPGFAGDPFAKFRTSKAFAESKKWYPPGWGANDRFADPKFTKLDTDWKKPLDLRLAQGSPAIDTGMNLPPEWPDPVRAEDKGKPDLGAIPSGVESWHIGIKGRLKMFGEVKAMANPPMLASMKFPSDSGEAPPVYSGKPAAIVEGYPAFDVPLLAFALRKRSVPVDISEKSWLDTKDYQKYCLVALVGDLMRAKMEPNKYTESDLKRVDAFLKDGGTLLLMGWGMRAFQTPHGQKYLQGLTGQCPIEKPIQLKILQPMHPWLKHLNVNSGQSWLPKTKATSENVLRTSKGENLIGTSGGISLLYRVPVGKGQLIYVGWGIAASLPATRDKDSSVANEVQYEEQMQILTNLVNSVIVIK